jgi:hypothetical protein
VIAKTFKKSLEDVRNWPIDDFDFVSNCIRAENRAEIDRIENENSLRMGAERGED